VHKHLRRSAAALLVVSFAAFASTFDTVTLEPNTPRPVTAPCEVVLLSDVLIDNTGNARRAFSYTPPPACSGAWAKVVLEADFHYEGDAPSDGTAGGIWLGGVNLWFGGTPLQDQEQRSAWHVERDLTDYNAVLRRAGTGHLQLDRAFSGQFTAEPSLRASARLLVYPAGPGAAAPRKPDAVYPLGTFVPGDTTPMTINTNHPTFPPTKLAGTFTLPRNVERAYLDVFAIGVDNDLVWWSCIPSHLYDDHPVLVRDHPFIYPATIGGCLRGSYREVQVTIDGQPAGVAPVIPWVPYQAFANDFPYQLVHGPTPAPRALNVLPYRVDLSPFAGVLSNGVPHEVAVTIALGDPTGGLDFEAAAALLVYRDTRSATVSGAVTRNTLAGTTPLPTVTETFTAGDGFDYSQAQIRTYLRRAFVIEGYIDTARGRIRNRVVQTTLFDNRQDLDVTSIDVLHSYEHDINLLSKTWRDSYSTLGTTQLLHDYHYFSTPLLASVTDWRRNQPGASNPINDLTFHQGIHQQGVHDRSNIAQFRTRHDQGFDATVRTTAYTGTDFNPFTWYSSASYAYTDNRDGCIGNAVTTNEGETTASSSGIACPGSIDFVRWFTRPDGAPESLGWAGYQ
jgi:hypothetical protein